jgi:hypothetical protein
MILELDEEELGEAPGVAPFFCTLDNLLTPVEIEILLGFLWTLGNEQI